MAEYYTAQICENGHIISAFGDSDFAFCEECGAKVINACPKCNAPVRGEMIDEFPSKNFEPPKHCNKCGSAFPWTK